MFINLIQLESKKIFRNRIFTIEVAILAGLIALILAGLYIGYLGNPASLDSSSDTGGLMKNLLTWPAALVLPFEFAGPSGLGGLLVIVLVGAITTQEYSWRTINLWLSHGTSRRSLVLAKSIALVLPILILVLIPALVGLIGTAVTTLFITGSIHATASMPWEVFLSVLRTAYGLLPYMALAFLLSVATRSTVATIGIGIGYSLLVESLLVQILTLIGGFAADLAQLLPGQLAMALLSLNQSGLQATPSQVGPTQIYLILGAVAAYAAGFLSLAAWSFQRQDLSG
jgi:ABC-type transport system involved in multi-copper enzyme maturation permease subunit